MSIDWLPAERYSLAEKAQADSQALSLPRRQKLRPDLGMTPAEVDLAMAQAAEDALLAAPRRPAAGRVTQPPPAADVASSLAYQQQTQALRRQVADLITRMLAIARHLPGRRAGDRFTRQVVPLVAAGQRQMSARRSATMTAQRQRHARPVADDPGRPDEGVREPTLEAVSTRARCTAAVPPRVAPARDLPHVDGAIEQAIQSGLDRAVADRAHRPAAGEGADRSAAPASRTKVAMYSRVLEGSALVRAVHRRVDAAVPRR
jgi:hypothetical protein